MFIAVIWLYSLSFGKLLKDKLQKLQNRAARVISGAEYDIRSADDVLDRLQWDTLQIRRASWVNCKGTPLYKILCGQFSPCLRDSFIKLKDTDRNYNLRNIETELALPKPNTNFLKRSFKYRSSMLWSFPSELKKATYHSTNLGIELLLYL